MTQSRFQSGALWLSLITLLVLLLGQMGLGQYIPVGWDIVTTGVVTALAFMGILTNPKDGKWYWNPRTSWKERAKSAAMWIGVAGALLAVVFQILKWFNVWPLPFDLKACIMTFLAILQATGIIDGTPVITPAAENPYLTDEYKESLKGYGEGG